MSEIPAVHQPRTRLEQLILARRWSIAEFVRNFDRVAADDSDRGGAVTASKRQSLRWMAGQTGLPRQASCRVLEQMFQEPAEALFAPAKFAAVDSRAAAPPVPTAVSIEPSGESHPRRTAETAPQDLQEVTTMAAAESARFIQFAEQTNTGPHTIAQLEDDLRRIVSTYPNRPVYPAFVEVCALRDRVFELLEGRQPPGQTRDLYLLAAALCGVLANASFDLGNFDAARTQARTAFLSAQLAGHNAMRAWIRGTQALIAYWDDRPREAIDLAADGWKYTPEQGTALVRLASIEARARARIRDHTGTTAALQRAEQARNAVHAPDDPGGMMAFPVAKQQFYNGAAALLLGDAANVASAHQHSSEAVASYEADPLEQRRVGELSLARMDLAAARLSSRDLEGAAEQVDLVLAVTGRRRTESVARRLHQFQAVLERPHFQTSSLATTLRDQIRNAPVHTPPALPNGAVS